MGRLSRQLEERIARPYKLQTDRALRKNPQLLHRSGFSLGNVVSRHGSAQPAGGLSETPMEKTHIAVQRRSLARSLSAVISHLTWHISQNTETLKLTSVIRVRV